MIKKIENIDIEFESILNLYKSVGWEAYTQDPESLKKALKNSSYLWAYFENDQLRGLIRGLTDGVSINYVQDILVLPELQGKGVGTRLVEHVFAQTSGVRAQVLLTDDNPGQLAFYKKLKMSNTRNLADVPLNCFVRFEGKELS